MNSRFIELPAIEVDEIGIKFYKLKINPFNIESFYETEIIFDDAKDIQACKLITKSGCEYDIDLSIDKLEEILNNI